MNFEGPVTTANTGALSIVGAGDINFVVGVTANSTLSIDAAGTISFFGIRKTAHSR